VYIICAIKISFESTGACFPLHLPSQKLTHCEFQAILGSLPDGFYRYFASRFPRLLIEVYKVMCVNCKDEEAFSKYFKGSSV
jgi:hypothetical protein